MIPIDTPRPGIVQVGCRHPWIVTFCLAACLLGGIAYLGFATPLYTASAQISVTPSVPRLIAQPESPATADTEFNYLNKERTVLLSRPILSEAVSRPGIVDSRLFVGIPDSVSHMKKRLRVVVGKKDGIISVEFDAPDREQGISLIAAIVDAYTSHHARMARRAAEDLLVILGQERAQCENRIAAHSSDMVKLKQVAGAASFDGKDAASSQALQELRDSLKVAGAELMAAEHFYGQAIQAYGNTDEHLKKIEDLEKSGSILAMSDVEQAQLRWAITDLEVRINELLRQQAYLPNHPQVRSLQARLDELRPAYVVASKRRLALAREREAAVRQAISAQQAIVMDIAAKASQYAALEAELGRLQRHADLLDLRINEIRAGQNTGAMKIVVVDPPAAEIKPSKPQPVRILGAALAVGLLLAAWMAYLRERLKPRLYSIQEARASLALPVLGVVPRMSLSALGRARPPMLEHDETRGEADTRRPLRAMVHFAESAAECRKLMVTSPMPADGRSTVVGNLGIALAEAGKRVLIVDADFEHPSLHRLFAVGHRVGLSSILRGEASAAGAIQRTAVEGLDVMSCGPRPRRVWHEMSSRRFHDLLDELAERYDHVLLDTAALSESRVAAAMCGACDGVVVVVRIGKTDAHAAEAACDGLVGLGARILGVVINAVPAAAGRGVSFFEVTAAPVDKRAEAPAAARARGAANRGEINVPAPRMQRPEH